MIKLLCTYDILYFLMQRKKKLSGQRKREELEREVCSTSFLETNKSSDSCTTSLATDTPNEHFTILYIHIHNRSAGGQTGSANITGQLEARKIWQS